MAVSFTMLLAPRFQAFKVDGTPLVGGKVYTYARGTVTPMTTYTTPGMSVANANPVVLDAAGQADIWWGGPMKIVVTDSLGVQQYSVDQLYGFGGTTALNLPTQDDDKYLVWDAVSGTFKNSALTRAAVETAVNAFNVALLNNGAVVVADTGDTSPGTLTDKITVTGAIAKTVNTDGSGVKTLNLNVAEPVGSTLYTYQNCNGF